jgi:hypothetical protein
MNETISASFVFQIDWSHRLGSPLYAEMLSIALEDLGRNGPVASVVRDFEGDAVPAALPLRMMGGLHRIVLGGQAPNLARHYPTTGGTPDGQTLPEDLLSTVDANVDYLRESLHVPPQTNEIGRSVALFVGLVTALSGEKRPVNLFEIGSSAGLNLMLDNYSYETGMWSREGIDGAPELRPDWRGHAPTIPESIEILSRRGCDTNPIDVTSDAERQRLVSFVWADQVDRFERINKAIDLVGSDSFRLDEADAAVWLRERLGESMPDGTLTVVQHSVMWQYLSEETQDDIDATFDKVGAEAKADRPIARVAFEASPDNAHEGHVLTVQRWPGGERKILGYGQPHGSWFTLL